MFLGEFSYTINRMSKLILLRHGQSTWNAADLFTGWVDIPLSQQGIDEAIAAGEEIASIPIQCIFTSTLIRAQQTAMLAMLNHRSKKIPVIKHEEPSLHAWETIYSTKIAEGTIPVYIDWRLNERYYGELQGQNKQMTREKYGEDQVKIWRRSFDIPPPGGESLEMTAKRTIPCLVEKIAPELEKGHNVLVAAHGNSLRSIVMAIENLSPEQVIELEIATGKPIFYNFAEGHYTRVKD